MKVTATALIAVALASGGTYTFDQAQVTTLNDTITSQEQSIESLSAEKEDAVSDKNEILKQYLCAKIEAKKTPTLDLSVTSAEEIGNAMVGIINGSQISNLNGTAEDIISEAIDRGELTCK